jgi:hypothetical protein
MSTGSIVLMLVYEPPSSRRGPVPLVRLEDPELALKVAQFAIAEAEVRASELSQKDEFLGEVEHAEAQRLRRVLAFLIPGLADLDRLAPTSVQ